MSNTNIFIPKTITVGYQKRTDTYTGQLAYVIYTDSKGILRKEKSWNGWRDKNIDPQTFDNTPVEGFVLNKKVGGDRYGWNPRQTYVRVYDPRGFEFEIIVPNLLYILENANSIKGKGLEGKFCYGWDGKELVLIPEQAPEFKGMQQFTLNQSLKFNKKDLEVGYKYLTKKSEVVTYMGKFEQYTPYSTYTAHKQEILGLKHWFSLTNKYGQTFVISTTISNIVKKLEIDDNYAFLVDKLEKDTRYSPVVDFVFNEIELNEVIDHLKNNTYINLWFETANIFFNKTIYRHYLTDNGNDIKMSNFYNIYGWRSLDSFLKRINPEYFRMQNEKIKKIFKIKYILENGNTIE